MANLYGAIARAETGGEDNPWIRTKVAPKKGSSAFGPVQITGTKAKDYATRNLISPESIQFINDIYGPLTDKFLKYGKEPDLEGYTPEFDYGGSGDFPEEYRDAYDKMANEMLTYDYTNNNGDPMKFIEAWRGVADDERYNEIVMQALEELQSK